MQRLAALLLVLVLTSGFALAQNSSALISEELDKIVALDIPKQTLPQAIQMITEKTGVRIDVAPQVYDLLPWGEQTTINAKFQNQTLRNDLAAITRKLG